MDPYPSSHFALVPPPEGVVYRVGRRNTDLWMGRDWSKSSSTAHVPGTFGNRFDDPGAIFDPPIPLDRRFQVVYAATTIAGAIGETIAGLRPSLEALARAAEELGQNDPDAVEAFQQLAVTPWTLDMQWRKSRQISMAQLPPEALFVDLMAPKTLQYLRTVPWLVYMARERQFGDIDRAFLMTSDREITCRISRLVYARTAKYADLHVSGIRYESRHGPGWDCWAIYQDRIRPTQVGSLEVDPANPGLLEAAAALGANIEVDTGEIIDPQTLLDAGHTR